MTTYNKEEIKTLLKRLLIEGEVILTFEDIKRTGEISKNKSMKYVERYSENDNYSKPVPYGSILDYFFYLITTEKLNFKTQANNYVYVKGDIWLEK